MLSAVRCAIFFYRTLVLAAFALLFSCKNNTAISIKPGTNGTVVIVNDINIAFGSRAVGDITRRLVTIGNSGALTVMDLSVAQFLASDVFQFEGGEFPGLGGNCTKALNPGATCTIEIVFAPEKSGSWYRYISFTYNDGIGQQSSVIPISGTAGTRGVLDLANASTTNFGIQAPATQGEYTIHLENKGELEISNITASVTGDSAISWLGANYPGAGGSCSATLGPGQICTLIFAFNPQTSGSYQSVVSLLYGHSASPSNLIFELAALSAPIQPNLRFVGIGKHIFDITTFGSSRSKEITISNSGFHAATELSLSIENPFYIEMTTCRDVIEVGQNCKISIGYSPSTDGLHSANLLVDHKNGLNNEALQTRFPFEGTGRSPAKIVYQLPSGAALNLIDFQIRGVNSETDFQVVLKNIGGSSAAGLSISPLTAPFTLISSFCSDVLPANAGCFAILRYSPFIVGNDSGTLSARFHNGSSIVEDEISVIAESRNLGVLKLLEPLPIAFGATTLNFGKEITLNVRNVGGGTAFAIKPKVFVGPFNYTNSVFPGSGGTCPSGSSFDLPAGDSCSLTLSFKPQQSGQTLDTLRFDYENGFQSEILMASLSGDGRTEAALTVALGTPEVDLSNRSINHDHYFIANITNSGTNTATNIVPTISSTAVFNYRGGTFPGSNPISQSGSCPAIPFSLDGGDSCTLYLAFRPTATLPYSETLTLSFDGTSQSNLVTVKNLVGSGANVGYLNISPSGTNSSPHIIVDTARGGFRDTVFSLSNTGQDHVTFTSIGGVALPFSIQPIGAPECGASLAPAQSCQVVVRYSPNAYRMNESDLRVNFSDGITTRTDSVFFRSNGVYAATLALSNAPTLDFGLTVVNTTSDRTITVTNTGQVSATTISFSNLTAPFSRISTTCGSTLAPNANCNFVVRYSPTVIGVLNSQNISLPYNDGAQTRNSNLTVKGTGEPPLHFHKGWTQIYAVGDGIDTSNQTDSQRLVRLSWNAMVPSSGSIVSYQIFRSQTSGVYDFGTPYASNISTQTRSFTDAEIEQSTIYYYTVRPVIMGFPSRTVDTYAEVRVIAPPANMALVHRWMSNLDFCTRIGKSVTAAQNNRCFYTGLGSSNGYFDVGSDLLVDKYELGVDLSSRKSQIPLANITQPDALMACQQQGTVTVEGLTSSGALKRLLSRREHLTASAWDPGLSSSQIINLQTGATPTSCNGDSQTLRKTGVSLDCVSRYGIMDMVGNAWEWVSDRVMDGVGVESAVYKLDPNNSDLDGVSFIDFLSSSELANLECISLALGLPVSPVGAACPGEAIKPLTYGTSRLLDGYYFSAGSSGVRFAIAGGSFNLTESRPSIYTSAFMNSNFRGATARCGLSVPE